jgi:Bacterial TSP3 repeat
MRCAVRSIGRVCVLVALVAAGCGPSIDPSDTNTNDNENNNNVGCVADDDGDSICNEFEGADSQLDSDGDGTPDYQDLDSDNDGISDSVEYGFEEPGTFPRDSDGDGIPNFQDTDSDNNGLTDDVDGVADLDMDGLGNYADEDDDGDGIFDTVEMAGTPFSPPDSDGDGMPDYQDVDSDGDTILDVHEGGGGTADTDGDTIPDYLDEDSDNDGLPDSLEAGDSDLATVPVDTDGDGDPDYRDPDSDNDGLGDGMEDANHNGVLDPGETDPYNGDTDGDGVSDLVEVAAGTDPQDNTDNPQANGDFVFLEPYQAPPDPTDDRLDFSTNFQAVDLYILEDVSGSMGDEVSSIASAMTTMINSITCSPGQTPAVDFCIPDVESGAGRFGAFVSGSAEIWSHLKDISADHAATQAALPTTVYGGSEQHIQAMSGAINGTCASDPNRIGTACFNTNSLAIILLVSDEDFEEDAFYNNASAQTTYDTMASLGVRVVGVTGNDDYNEIADLRQNFIGMSGGNPAVQLVPSITSIPNTPQCNALGATPFFSNRAIVSGPDSQAANAMTCAIQAITAYLPQDVYPELVNDPANVDHEGVAVDAVSAFVDYIEVFEDGSPECSAGNTVDDSDGDGHADTYVGILPGTPVCWRLFVKENNTVTQSTEGPQMFMATVQVHGEGGALLDSRDVYFLVPPDIDDVIVPQ